VRGPARLVASVTSHLAPLDASDLAAVDRIRWQAMRADIAARRLQRTRGSRFRRDPEAYLRTLEAQYAAAKWVLPFWKKSPTDQRTSLWRILGAIILELLSMPFYRICNTFFTMVRKFSPNMGNWEIFINYRDRVDEINLLKVIYRAKIFL
jgi:hypothetical protein